MKYNTNECLERMIRVIGEDHVKKYQEASASCDYYGNDPLRKIYVDNPLKMNILNYVLAVNECIAELFTLIPISDKDKEKQFIEDVKYFQQVYKEDIKGE